MVEWIVPLSIGKDRYRFNTYNSINWGKEVDEVEVSDTYNIEENMIYLYNQMNNYS